MTVRVLLADDHLLVRAGFRALLGGLPDVEVVGEVTSGMEVPQAVEELSPDVVLMDISMPGMNGLEAARRLADDHPDARVIMVSMHSSEDFVARALKAGARGYLTKASAAQELERALTAVMAGEQYIDSHVSRDALETYMRRLGDAEGGKDVLTARQREILQLIAESLGTKEIAHRLGVSTKTVETHRKLLMDRLNIHDVAGLVRYAIRTGVVSPDGSGH
jgi:DNA-binding NarL/FixJ family response regulator